MILKNANNIVIYYSYKSYTHTDTKSNEFILFRHTKDTTKGATIEPILAHILLVPTPMFLTTVGNNSPEKR